MATVFLFGAIVVRPSSSVVVSRRPSLSCARACVCVCTSFVFTSVARAIAARHRRDSFVAPAQWGAHVTFWISSVFIFVRRPARRGFLRKSTPLSVRNRGSIFNRIPAGHGTGVPDTRFFFRWTVWPSFKKKIKHRTWVPIATRYRNGGVIINRKRSTTRRARVCEESITVVYVPDRLSFVYCPWNDCDDGWKSARAPTGNGKKSLFVGFVRRSVRRRPTSSPLLQEFVRQVHGARDDQVAELCRSRLDRQRTVQHCRIAAAGN